MGIAHETREGSREEAAFRALRLYAGMLAIHAELLAAPSATATLESWCRRHGLGSAAEVTARPLVGGVVPPTPARRARLRVREGEPVVHRRVELTFGPLVLARADNWYVPGRLTLEMKAGLAASAVSFGRVIAPLKPFRRLLAAGLVWEPLPQDWSTMPLDELRRQAQRDTAYRPDRPLFHHQALVLAEGGEPIAEVHETFLMALLAHLA